MNSPSSSATRPHGRVVFAGYAPVHFVCFQPIYERLRRAGGIEVFLSGGRAGTPDGGAALTASELYASFDVDRDRVIELDAMAAQEFDITFCAHVSGYFPKDDLERVQLFHGVSFRNMAVRRDVLVYDRLFLVGPYMRRLFTESHLVRDRDPKLVNIGFPKLDRLVDGSLDRAAVLRGFGFEGDRPVILYAPTGQRDNSLEHTGEAVLTRLRRSGRYDILIKLHDHPRDRGTDWHARLAPLLDAHTRMVPGYDIVPAMFAADLLITDASSVSNEYALLDRPIVFLDVPQLLAAMQRKGVALDLDTWGRKGGPVVQWPDEAVDAVASELADPTRYGAVRRAMAQDLFYNPGRATDAAVEWTLRRLAEARG